MCRQAHALSREFSCCVTGREGSGCFRRWPWSSSWGLMHPCSRTQPSLTAPRRLSPGSTASSASPSTCRAQVLLRSTHLFGMQEMVPWPCPALHDFKRLQLQAVPSDAHGAGDVVYHLRMQDASFPLPAAYRKGVRARATLLAVLEENLKFLRARNQRKRWGVGQPCFQALLQFEVGVTRNMCYICVCMFYIDKLVISTWAVGVSSIHNPRHAGALSSERGKATPARRPVLISCWMSLMRRASPWSMKSSW